MYEERYHPALHAIALATACATFPLIFMGGLVTSHGAGLAVPDWPNSYGYNMFLFPPRLWVGNIFYEHTHRLMATVVGMLAIALTFAAWRTAVRPAVRWLATALLGAVIIQGIVGGLRVVLINLDLAIVHACLAQATFCLAVWAAAATSRRWTEAPDLSRRANSAGGRGLVRLGMITVGVIYVQLVIGAIMRHFHAGLAIPDFPLSFGHVLPPFTASALALAWKSSAPMPPLAAVWIHFAHRVGALVVTALVISLVTLVAWHHRRHAVVLRPALALAVLLPVQITLGILTVLLHKPADIASAHVAVGALTLASAFVLTAGAVRVYRPRRAEAPRRFSVLTAAGVL